MYFNIHLFFRIGAPFLMYNIVFEKSVTVSAKGIICSVFLIIMVLVAVTSILACFKRKLSTIVSIIYIFIYFLFVIVSLGFVYKWFECPVWNKYTRKMLINHLIIKFLFLLHKVKNSFLRLFIDISSNRSKFCRTVILLYAESRDSDYCGTNFQNRQFVTYC